MLRLLFTLLTVAASARTTLENDQGLPSASQEWKQAHRTPDKTLIPLIVHPPPPEEQATLLEQHFWSVSDPNHASYGNHLTQDQVTRLVAHPPLKLHRVLTWLSDSGASEIKVNAHKDSVHFVATSKQVEHLFHTKMYAYVHVTRDMTLHRASQSYSVPDELAASVALVSGLLRLPDVERLGGTVAAEENKVSSLHHCSSNADCSGLCTYCQNGVGKTPPFNCHAPAEGCCLDDSDCKGSYCQNGPGHPQPWKCHGKATAEDTEQENKNTTPWPSDCKSCSQKVTPGVLAARYSFPTPTPQDPPATLGISEFQGQVWDQAGLNTFSKSCSGPSGSVNFNITVNHENGTVSPGKQCKIPILGTTICGEAMLDIEYSKAVAGPAIALTDLYQKSFNLLTWSTSVENIDDANLIGVHSISYGNDEKQQPSTAFMTSFNMAAMKIGVRGVSILFASGDQGVCGRSGCGFGKSVRFHPDFPSGSPYVTSVGGTDFVTRSVIGDEKAWQSGGGGFSDTFAIPDYQKEAVAKYKSSPDAKLPPQSMWNNTGRGYPDVAALAGQQNSYCIAISSGMMGIYGTSGKFAPVV